MGRPTDKQRDWLSEHYHERGVAKQSFATFAGAKLEADRRNERDRDDGDYRPSRAYQCGYCAAFHIGHSNPKKWRRGRT